jgi:hypothetical protein
MNILFRAYFHKKISRRNWGQKLFRSGYRSGQKLSESTTLQNAHKKEKI